MSTVSPTIHRFALPVARAGNQGDKAVATCFSASSSGGNGAGGVTDSSGTYFFAAGKGSAFSLTGSSSPITSSLAGGEVPLLLSRVPVLAELVPVSASQVRVSLSLVLGRPGKFRRRLHRFRRCRGGGTGGVARVFQTGTSPRRVSAHEMHGSARNPLSRRRAEAQHYFEL